MRTSPSTRAALRAVIAVSALAVGSAVAIATDGGTGDDDLSVRASRPAPMIRYGSADAAEQWLSPSGNVTATFGSADAAEQWLSPDEADGVTYGSADAAERWLSSDR